MRARRKYDGLAAFSRALPALRARIDAGLRAEAGSRELALAAVLALLDRAVSLLLQSYEDSSLGHAFSRDLEAHHDGWLGRSRRRISLIVSRNPFNLFASRLRQPACHVHRGRGDG